MSHNSKSIKFLFICFFLLLAGIEGKSQDNKALFQMNYATFQMKEIKEMQKGFADEIRDIVGARVTSSFPAYIGYEMNLNTKFDEDHYIGGYVGYYSTGGRIHYKDYSGEMKLDQLLTNYSLGIYNEFILHHFSESDLFFSTRAGATLTQYQINHSLQIGTETESDVLGFNSANLHLSPGLGYRYPLTNIFFIQAEARYEIHIPGSLHLNTDRKAKLVDDRGRAIKAHWDGLRIGFSLGASFF